MNITFFSSSEFTLPIIQDIFDKQGKSLSDVFLEQYSAFIKEIKEDNTLNYIYPKQFDEFDFITSQVLESFNSPISLNGLVSAPEKENRGKIITNPIIKFAKDFNIPFSAPKSANKEFSSSNDSFLNKSDVAILASYGQMISDQVLETPKYGFINWHPSSLPKYRGASPMQEVLKNGDTKSSLTWLNMVKKMDAGNIWLQIPYEIGINIRLKQLIDINVEIGKKTWSLPIVAKAINSKNLDTL